MTAFDAAKFLKEMPHVLSHNEDIYLVHYMQPQETEKVNVRVHMNLISLVLHGRKEIYHQSGKTVIEAGMGFFMKKGAYLMTERIAATGANYEAITILFSDEWLLAEAASLLNLTTCTLQDKDTEPLAVFAADALLRGLTAQLSAYFESGVDKKRLNALLPVKVRELLQVLLSSPGDTGFSKQLQNIRSVAGPDLLKLMERHYKENLSLEQYAFLANYSLSTFKRKFSQAFHMPPRKWIQQRRLEEAYILLSKADRNVTEIAYEVGFESPAHFISSFKEYYHITPKQLQQQLQTAQAV
jgi:AraC-like DNA-binding protein